MTKPITLILDFDGVINRWTHDGRAPGEVDWKGISCTEIRVHRTIAHDIFYSRELVNALNNFVDEGLIKIVWCTAWEKDTELFDCIDMLYPYLKLGEESGGDWFWQSKGKAVKEYAETHDEHIIWVDDDLLDSPQSLKMAQEMNIDVVHTTLDYGITPGILDEIQQKMKDNS